MVLELEHCALKIGYTQICTERARAREMAHKTGSKYFILLPQTIPLIESISAARKEALHRVILLMCVFITFQCNHMKNCDFPGRMCPSSRVLVLSRPFCRQSDSCSQLLPQPGVCAIQKKKSNFWSYTKLPFSQSICPFLYPSALEKAPCHTLAAKNILN